MKFKISFYITKKTKGAKSSFLQELKIYENDDSVAILNVTYINRDNFSLLVDAETLKEEIEKEMKNRRNDNYFANIVFDVPEENVFYFQMKYGNDFLKYEEKNNNGNYLQ